MAHEAQVNAGPLPKKAVTTETLAASGPVWVSDTYFGPAVTNVKQTTGSAEKMYFLNLSNSTAAHSVLFVVSFKSGSPLTSQTQSFQFPGGGYAGSITTPFGVPNWGGNPILGPAVLSVLVNGVPVGSYNFNVTT